jgi:methylmalonyl-CoA mutase N-terminal domain/subunit
MASFEERLKKWSDTTLAKGMERGERREKFETTSGIPVQRLYGPGDAELPEKIGMPAEYPFTRGVQPTMYRGQFWTMRQYAGFGSAEESNQRNRYLLDHGTTGLSVAFDLPTQMAVTRPRARARRGRQGRRGNLVARGHGNPVQRHPARQGHDRR